MPWEDFRDKQGRSMIPIQIRTTQDSGIIPPSAVQVTTPWLYPLIVQTIILISHIQSHNRGTNLDLNVHYLNHRGPSLEDIVKTLATNTLQFQQETRTTMKNLETQVSQLANTVGRLEAQG